ncbi:MAG TPA: inositol monophosphatase family protein [Myxococcales bacterium]|nr:inositol monophosphatase family protein [Myxococcales bacterium]
MAESVDDLMVAAEAVAKRGGEVLKERWRGPRTVDFKGGIDLVTDADRAAEKAILEMLREKWPTHDVVAEESSAQVRGGSCRWHVDPLDGTTNYAHGIPHFCVSVGIEDGRGLAAGAVFNPLLGELFVAGRGKGAFLDGRKIQVSQRKPLGQCLIATGFPYDIWTKPDRPLALFREVVTHARGVRRFGAAALDLAYVASGRFDGFFELNLRSWDVAAGTLLVLEAGGVVTDMVGAPARLDAGEILAGSPYTHPELLELTKKVPR